MAAITDNRKRSREDDNCDFMPLSKRINNLHINNVVTASRGEQVRVSPTETYRETASAPTVAASENLPPYNPGISSSQSHYYYENKVLYELYLERIRRTGQTPQF